MSDIKQSAQPSSSIKITVLISSAIALISTATLVALFATGAIGNKTEYVLSLPADRFYQDEFATSPILDVGFVNESVQGSVYEYRDKTDAKTLQDLLKKVFKLEGEFESLYEIKDDGFANYRLETEDGILEIGVGALMNFQYTNKQPIEENDGPAISDQDAKAKTASLFTELGFKTSTDDVRIVKTTDNERGTQVDEKIDGFTSGQFWNIFWTDGGSIDTMTGYNFDFVKVGDVELISADQASNRIMDYTWYAHPQEFDIPLPSQIRPTEVIRSQTSLYNAENNLVSVPVYSFRYEGGKEMLDILAVKKLHLIPFEAIEPQK